MSEWLANIEDEDVKGALSKFESQDQLFETIGYTPEKVEVVKDWKEGLDEDLKKTAERFNTEADMLRTIQDYRKKDSLVRVPGKNATDEEVAAYKKAIGVPEDINGYEFPEVEDMTDEVKEAREQWAQSFLELNIPKEAANKLIGKVGELQQKVMEKQIEADKAFAKSQLETLEKDWKGDFEKNKTYANRAFAEIANRAGISVEELTQIETKDGQFLLDRADMLKMFSIIGREMSEGTLGPIEVDRDTLDDEIKDVRKQIQEAQDSGDSKRANQLYQREQKLLSKLGNQPIVGSQGRAA